MCSLLRCIQLPPFPQMAVLASVTRSSRLPSASAPSACISACDGSACTNLSAHAGVPMAWTMMLLHRNDVLGLVGLFMVPENRGPPITDTVWREKPPSSTSACACCLVRPVGEHQVISNTPQPGKHNGSWHINIYSTMKCERALVWVASGTCCKHLHWPLPEVQRLSQLPQLLPQLAAAPSVHRWRGREGGREASLGQQPSDCDPDHGARVTAPGPGRAARRHGNTTTAVPPWS